MYRYIGNKSKLLPEIMQKTEDIIGKSGVVVDLMAGTGTVSLEYRRRGYTVIASDVMTYSKHHLNVNLLLKEAPSFENVIEVQSDNREKYEEILLYLNSLESEQGYFYNEFSPEGKPQNGCPPRKYFTSKNAAKIDAIRKQINIWIEQGKISNIEESLLKHSLIMAVNRVANISGTYGYFLSEFKKNTLDDIKLLPVQFEHNNNIDNIVIQGFAEEIASQIRADLCYIDPPYIKRQYAANYHILETIARGDYPEAVGKSGLRDWWDQHSKFCTKTKGLEAFKKVIQSIECDNIIISYSEDGLFTLEQLTECFREYGEVTVEHIDYNRFKSNNSKLPKKLKEYIITIRK